MGEVSFSQLCAWQVLLLLHWVMNWTWHNRDMWVAISDNLPLLIPPMGANQSSKFLSVDMLWCIQSLVTLGSLYMSLKGISAKYVYRWMCVWIAGGVGLLLYYWNLSTCCPVCCRKVLFSAFGLFMLVVLSVPYYLIFKLPVSTSALLYGSAAVREG